MLILSRLRDETIMIGDDIEVMVVAIRGDKVRLGITAPTSLGVHRKEVWVRIQEDRIDAGRAIAPVDNPLQLTKEIANANVRS